MLVAPMNRGSQTAPVASEWRQGMRRNANGTRDLLAPMEIGEEVLAEALACHAWKCSRGRDPCSVTRGGAERRRLTGDSRQLKVERKTSEMTPCRFASSGQRANG